MEIHARIPLTLPNEFYRTTLSYDTYEKATFDLYLAACIVKNAKTEKKAATYIDDITGNGSLNNHFRKLYDKVAALSDEQVDGILKNSLFPITKLEKGHYKYYPMLKASRLNDRSYPGDLKEDEQKLIDVLMPKTENAKFLKMEYEKGEANLKEDLYEAIFSEEGIKINLGDGKFYPISQEDFSSIFTNDLAGEPLNMAVGKEISSGNWSVLQRTYFDAIEKAQLNWYYDRKKNLCLLNSDFIKTVEVIQLFGLYFYKETKHEFIPQNEEHIVDALAYLEKSKNINTFKTKSLVLMLKSIDDVKAQQYINYVLGRKESKEIAEVGLYFLKNGLELGWDEGAVLQFKKFADISMISRIYELNPKLDYSIEELLNIDDSVLSKKHLKEKQEYITVRENMMKEIKLMLGDMDVSPVREKSKSLPKDSVVNSVKEFYNNMKAHNKIDYASLSTEELTKKYQYIKSMYEGNYKKVLARIEKMENK